MIPSWVPWVIYRVLIPVTTVLLLICLLSIAWHIGEDALDLLDEWRWRRRRRRREK